MTPDPDVDSTDELAARATKARERFLHSVEALDRKRHQLTRPARAVGKTLQVVAAPTFQPALVVVGALASAAMLLAAVVQGRRRERRRPIFTAPRRSFLGELLWHAGLGLASVSLTGAARLGLKAVLQGSQAPHRARLGGPREAMTMKKLQP